MVDLATYRAAIGCFISSGIRAEKCLRRRSRAEKRKRSSPASVCERSTDARANPNPGPPTKDNPCPDIIDCDIDKCDSKKSSISKPSKIYNCTYETVKKSFSKYPELKSWCLKSKQGKLFVYCSLCDSDFKIASRGILDVLRHAKSTTHQETTRIRTETPQLDKQFFTKENDPLKDKVTKAECIWSKVIAKHNVSFKTSECLLKAVKLMLPDSEIAKQMKCGRSKIKSIITQAIAPEMEKDLINKMRNEKFCLLTDDTTDISTKQQCCILVRLFDEHLGTVRAYVFKVLHLTSATGQNIFESITSVFKQAKIPLENIFAMGTDGANTMIGKSKGLFGRMKNIQSKIISVWCMSHRIHIVCRKGVSNMPSDINELPVLLYYWFKKSSKRQVGLERMQDFCGIVHHKLLKPSDTRWLAMQQISSRLAEQWDALKAYFNSLPVDHELNEEGQKSRKLDKYTKEKLCKIKSALNNDRNRLCYLFLKQYLLKFTCFNQFFQTTRPVAYLTISKLQSLYKDILNCFIHPSIVNQSKANLLSIDTTDPDNIMDRDSIWYGDSQVFDICGELEDNGQIDIVKEFQSIVLDSYQRSIQQMQTLPFDDELLRDIQCLDPAKQGKESVRPAFTKLARQFPDVIPKGELGKLDAELRTYDTYDLPADTDRDDVAKFWVTVGSITDSVQKTFPILFKLSRALLIIPHGNAESEQLFSRLSLLKTKFKSHMTGETLNSVLAINFNNQDECYNFKPSRSVIENARRATTAQNQRQKTHVDSDQESDFEEVTVVECRPTRQRKSKRNFDFVYE